MSIEIGSQIDHPAPRSAARPLPEPVQHWAGTTTGYPRDKTVSQVFEEAAARHGDRIALIFDETQLSYRQLNRRANRLARQLRTMGVGPETLVGVCLERSIEMIVALLGILKAGAAYVPFDPGYPRERLEWMLADTATPVIITQRSLTAVVKADRQVPVVLMDDALVGQDSADNEWMEDEPAADTLPENAYAAWERNPPQTASANSLAYVMYTSGSTGRPKGVMVEHRSIVRLVCDTDFCRFGPEHVFLQYAPVSFDASTLEIWGALLHGATLVVMPPQSCSLDQLGSAVRNHGVTTLWLTAGLFHLFVDERLDDLGRVQQLIAGGDTLSLRHVQQVLQSLPGTTLINGYGPTEGTTFTCCHTMRAGETVAETVPIGRPISNTRVYILDEEGNPVEPGQPGELWAAGDGVARGYLNAPELTAEKFFPDPFSADIGARMYRTGDRARWNKDGIIEFLGRMDNQLKILGHRIEPGEIEAALCGHPDVLEACVVCHADDSGAKRLAAYFVSRKESSGVSQLKEFLGSRLPPYMVPAQLVELDALPLNANGKVDRGKLAELRSAAPILARDASPPPAESALEAKVAAIWKSVLDLSQLGLDDNFFDIGGDSLLLVAVHSQLQKLLEIKIQVIDLFEFTTVRTLAARLQSSAAPESAFTLIEQRAQKQREALARQRALKGSMA